MPNWCAGELKVRGKKQDIENFIENNIIHYLDWTCEESETFKKNIDEDDYIVYILENYESHNQFSYLKDSRRHFISNNEIIVQEMKNNESISIMNFRAAHDIDTDYLVKVSEEYNLDLKIYAFECGMEFNRDIEVHKGQVIKDETIEFKDYQWECVCPNIGG